MEFDIKSGITIDGGNPINAISTETTLSASSDTTLVSENAINIYTNTKINELDIVSYATTATLGSHTSDTTIHYPISAIDGLVVSGGIVGQVLTKTTSADYDYDWTSPAGTGDMLKSIYDTTNNGIVDNSEALGGYIPEYYATSANLNITSATVNSHTSDTTIHYTEASIDHGSISGLLDFDHPQYATTATLDSQYLTSAVIDSRYATTATAGDMFKAIYDITDSGIVDNSERFGSELPEYYATTATLDSQYLMSAVIDSQYATTATLNSHTSDGTIHFTQGSISIPASQISDFDTEVSNNTSVVANTAKVTNATHTGDVTGFGALTIANDVVSNTNLSNMGQSTIKGRASGAGTGDPTDLTASQVRTIIGNTTAQWNANQLQGSSVYNTSPSDGQVLTYDTTNGWQPETAGGKDTYFFDFEKIGSASGSFTINGKDGYSYNLGYVVPFNINITGIEFITGLSSSSQTTSITLRMARYTIPSGTQYSYGAGTQLSSDTILSVVGAQSSMYYRNTYLDKSGAPISVSTGNMVTIDLTLDFWSITDIQVRVFYEKA